MSQETAPSARLVSALFAALKLTAMYDHRHDAVSRSMEKLLDALRRATAGTSTITVTCRARRILVDGKRIQSRDAGVLPLQFLADAWTARKIESVHLPARPAREELLAFCSCFNELDVDAPDPVGRLQAALAARGAPGFQVEEREDADADPLIKGDRRESALRTYLQGMRSFRAVLRGRGIFDRGKMRRTRRAVQSLVDRFLEDDQALLALTRMLAHDSYLFQHSLHVCVYALAVGLKLGFNRKQLNDLGLSALFHDLGKTVQVEERYATPDVDHHPARGARLLLQTAGSQEGLLKAAIAAYEHHVHHDGSGHPKIGHQTHLYSRIVAIADCFEALTTSRTFHATPFSPQEAFTLMQAKSGSLFDPLLLKVFVQAIGPYPVGTLVQLSTGEVGLVVRPPKDNAPGDRPCVRVIRSEAGQLPVDTHLDLSLQEVDRRISRTVSQVEVYDRLEDLVANLQYVEAEVAT